LLRKASADEKVKPLTLWPLGRAQLLGIGTARDMPAGVATLETSLKVDPGRADAWYLVGRAYQNGWGGVAPDPAKAYSHLKEGARLGDNRAERYVGMALLNGDGVERDEVAAMAAFRSAAQQGNVDAMIDIAVMLALGEGVPADAVQARAWYRRAADKGSVHALRGLGAMLARGEGGAAEPATGRAYLELAEQGGDPNARKILDGALGALPAANRGQIDAAKAAWRKEHAPPAH
ncbi:MAG: sel1 repeat family protein, partial [Phenylobacterium sp.]|nr:sel1 repeat family protein [Phenylobacterium sp.]